MNTRTYDSHSNSVQMWLSVDPMSDKYPSLSPYNYCAWNPVMFIDPDGREIEEGSKAEWSSRKSDIQTRIKNLEASLVDIGSSKMSDSKKERKTNQINSRISALEGVLDGMGQMETSSQMYRLIPGQKEGETRLNNKDGVIELLYDNSTGSFVHEVSHGIQYENRDIGFSQINGMALAADLLDEVAAYKNQFAYDGSLAHGLNPLYSPLNMSQITPDWVSGIVQNGKKKYAGYGIAPLNGSSGAREMDSAYPGRGYGNLGSDFRIDSTRGAKFK